MRRTVMALVGLLALPACRRLLGTFLVALTLGFEARESTSDTTGTIRLTFAGTCLTLTAVGLAAVAWSVKVYVAATDWLPVAFAAATTVAAGIACALSWPRSGRKMHPVKGNA